MAELVERTGRPDLEAPVLVVSLAGFIDAGGAAELAVDHLLQQLVTTPVARFDTDELVDRRARRPVMHLVDGVNTGIESDQLEVRAAQDGSGNDVLLLTGPEPDYRWRRFADSVVELASELGVRMICGLGAYPAPAPHTRPARVVSTATSQDLADQVGHLDGAIDVPASALAAIELACAERRLPAVGLWGQVPHYVAAMPYPAAAIALIEQLNDVGGLDLSSASLTPMVAPSIERIDQLVANNDEAAQVISQLERYVDALDGSDDGELPSGDELADEIQRFLGGLDE